MKYSEAIEPVTKLKTSSRELILKAKASERPVIITQNGKATAVLQDIESFERQRDALLLLKFLARSDEELREGKGVTHAAAKKRIASVLGSFED
jgi:prevent-host-death family protein